MTEDELLCYINKERKIIIKNDDIFSSEIDLGLLKNIDKLFNKGLNFYLDSNDIAISRDASIFFRKTNFNSDLSMGARVIVNKFEEFKIHLSAISKLADINLSRVIPVYNTKQDPKTAASRMRDLIHPGTFSKKKDFLHEIINKLAENNVLVFEFVETWNKKDRANIDGFFLEPNVIVIKRIQKSFSREIFTLAHEIGHYLLNAEEIE